MCTRTKPVDTYSRLNLVCIRHIPTQRDTVDQTNQATTAYAYVQHTYSTCMHQGPCSTYHRNNLPFPWRFWLRDVEASRPIAMSRSGISSPPYPPRRIQGSCAYLYRRILHSRLLPSQIHRSLAHDRRLKFVAQAMAVQ